MAIVLHPSQLSTAYAKCSLASPSIRRQFLHSLNLSWACDLLWTMLKSSEPGPKEALHNCLLTYGILLPPYKEAQASLWRRRNTVESNSVFPATSTEPSNCPALTNPRADHRYINDLSQDQPSQPRPAFQLSRPKLPATKLSIKLVVVILRHYVVGLFVL